MREHGLTLKKVDKFCQAWAVYICCLVVHHHLHFQVIKNYLIMASLSLNTKDYFVFFFGSPTFAKRKNIKLETIRIVSHQTLQFGFWHK